MQELFKSPNLKVFFYIVILHIFLINISFGGAVLQLDRIDSAEYYVIYWRTASEEYSEDFSYELQDEITEFPPVDLPNNEIYYFAVKVFNHCGNSSGFSEELEITDIEALKILELQDMDFISPSNNSGGCFIDMACLY